MISFIRPYQNFRQMNQCQVYIMYVPLSGFGQSGCLAIQPLWLGTKVAGLKSHHCIRYGYVRYVYVRQLLHVRWWYILFLYTDIYPECFLTQPIVSNLHCEIRRQQTVPGGKIPGKNSSANQSTRPSPNPLTDFTQLIPLVTLFMTRHVSMWFSICLQQITILDPRPRK